MTRTLVARLRLPRDRSFLYLRLEGSARRLKAHAEWIQRRYYSTKRLEVMRFKR